MERPGLVLALDGTDVEVALPAGTFGAVVVVPPPPKEAGDRRCCCWGLRSTATLLRLACWPFSRLSAMPFSAGATATGSAGVTVAEVAAFSELLTRSFLHFLTRFLALVAKWRSWVLRRSSLMCFPSLEAWRDE